MKLLFVFDWILMLPITLIRTAIIYFEGSHYDADGLRFLDVIMHSKNKYFNQNSLVEPSVDLIEEDIRKVIKMDSQIYKLEKIENNNNYEIIENNDNINEIEYKSESEYSSDDYSEDNRRENINTSTNNFDKDSINLDKLIENAKNKINTMILK